MKENPILFKSFAFSLQAIKLYKSLISSKEYDLAKQFFKSSTSICANVNEATAAISYKDFTSKMSIASKEARESLYWLKIIEAGRFTSENIEDIIKENEEIVNIITAIVKTCQEKIKQKERN
jgi:four helix bundle protein